MCQSHLRAKLTVYVLKGSRFRTVLHCAPNVPITNSIVTNDIDQVFQALSPHASNIRSFMGSKFNLQTVPVCLLVYRHHRFQKIRTRPNASKSPRSRSETALTTGFISNIIIYHDYLRTLGSMHLAFTNEGDLRGSIRHVFWGCNATSITARPSNV